jgi:D-alanine-D-alanine ligase
MQIIVLTSSFAQKSRADQKDSLVQVSLAVDILSRLGFEVSIISATMDMESLGKQLDMLKPGLVFNLVEEIHGTGAFIHYPLAVLETKDIPFTGNNYSAMLMTSSKLLAKKILLAHGILTPDCLSPDMLSRNRIIKDRYIIKSVWEHGSLGLSKESIIKEFTSDKIETRIKKLKKKYQGSWFVEKYIPGREINVSILETPQGPQILPIAEIIFSRGSDNHSEIVDYQAKWNEKSSSFRNTQRHFLSDKDDNLLITRVSDTALKCWKIFELSGYARVDFRVDPHNIPYVLEINANPCLSPDSGFMAAAQKSGLTPVQTINAIVQAGLNKYQSFHKF